MWIVVLTGAFGVLTLLVKAAIDTGRKTTRWRREITLDVELLSKLREAHPNSPSGWDLEQRIDRQLLEYAWLGTTHRLESPAEEEAAALHRRAVRWSQAGASAIAIGTALISGVLLNWTVDGLAGTETTVRFEDSLPVVIALLGIASALAGFAVGSRSLRPEAKVALKGTLRRKRAGESTSDAE